MQILSMLMKNKYIKVILVSMSAKQQIVVIHGGTTYNTHEEYMNSLYSKTPKLEWIQARRDWKNELQNHLGDDFVVYVPQMPNKTNAQYNEWKIVFEKILDLVDEDTILIGHSLGGLFLTKFLSENKVSKKIQKTFLIATPFDDEGMHETLCSFLRRGTLEQFQDQAGVIYIYQSEDDFVVPFDHLNRYHSALPGAVVRGFKDRNHFLQESIPELITDIQSDKT